MRPDKWSKRSWIDAFEGWQFRTYSSPRTIQVCFHLQDYQGDGMLHLSVHLWKKALAFECPLKVSRELTWKLVK